VPGPVTDFQDIPLWRKLTAEFAIGLVRDYQRPVVAPMTLINADYRDSSAPRTSPEAWQRRPVCRRKRWYCAAIG
jgi:hypothetical protein